MSEPLWALSLAHWTNVRTGIQVVAKCLRISEHLAYDSSPCLIDQENKATEGRWPLRAYRELA
jgi:hypothetical protein